MLASAKSSSAFDHFEDFCRRVAFERFDTFDENRQIRRARTSSAREHHYANFPLDLYGGGGEEQQRAGARL